MKYQTRKRKAASERGKRMAARRWQIDRAMRERIAAIAPEQLAGRIVRRIVDIRDEATVREVVIYDFDSRRSAMRKVRSIL